MKSFFLPMVIVVTTLIYWLWPSPEHEILKPTAHADAVTVIPETKSATPTSPIPNPQQNQPPGQLPVSPQPAASDDRLVQCWKTIQQQMAEHRPAPTSQKKKQPRYVRFAETLAKAGLLDDSKIKENPEQALRRLARMSRRDPQNSAPLLFSAAIEFNRGNTIKAEQFLAQARTQTTKFDSYLKSYSRNILSQVSTPAELVTAFEILSKVKTPDYSSLQKMLVDMNQPELARQLMSDGLDERKVMEGVDWIPAEYAIGQSILKAQGDSNSYPTYQDLVQKKQDSGAMSAESIQNHLQENCDLQSLAPLVEQLKTELRNRKR